MIHCWIADNLLRTFTFKLEMFFIAPQAHHDESPKSAASTKPIEPTEPTKSTESSRLTARSYNDDDLTASYYPKRTPKACDRCRLKKTRCSAGRGACTKCKTDGVVCATSSQSRRVDTKLQNPKYIQMVETQRDLLVRALQKIRQQGGCGQSAVIDVNSIFEELNLIQKRLPNYMCDSRDNSTTIHTMGTNSTPEQPMQTKLGFNVSSPVESVTFQELCTEESSLSRSFQDRISANDDPLSARWDSEFSFLDNLNYAMDEAVVDDSMMTGQCNQAWTDGISDLIDMGNL